VGPSETLGPACVDVGTRDDLDARLAKGDDMVGGDVAASDDAGTNLGSHVERLPGDTLCSGRIEDRSRNMHCLTLNHTSIMH
jgi:hypothetical protein